MDPVHLMTQTATISHVSQTGALDDYGNPAEVVTTSDSPCFLSTVTGVEADLEAVQIHEPLLFLPATETIDGGDRITVDGVTYEVSGPIARRYNPRVRRESHLEVPLKRAV